MPGSAVRDCVYKLFEVLERSGESVLASRVSSALAGTDADFDAFIVSNDLWGGSGSIADQAGVGLGHASGRRSIEAVLIELGELQEQAGKVNARTAMWVAAFKEWRRNGI
jgi:hypothetical protein